MTATVRNPESITERAADLLSALGDTRNQVAQRLLDGAHFGERSNCGACPVDTYLMASDLRLHAVAVGMWGATLWPSLDDHDWHCVDLPEPVQAFVYAFDTGNYDELLATNGGGVA